MAIVWAEKKKKVRAHKGRPFLEICIGDFLMVTNVHIYRS